MNRFARDAQTRFHEEWLGLAQPIEGLVFSIPVLADAQIRPAPDPELTARFRRWLWRESAEVSSEDDAAPLPEIEDLRTFFAGFLGYTNPAMLPARDELPESLHFFAEEGRQDIRPSFAIARAPFEGKSSTGGNGDGAGEDDDPFGGFDDDQSENDSHSDATDDTADATTTATDDASSPWLALVWDVRDDAGEAGLGLSLDRSEDASGPWRYPPTAKLERLLRHTGIPIGLLSNGRELRLVYAPPRESTSHLTFRFAEMADRAGRPVLAAFELLLGARRTYGASEAHTLSGLLRESRRRQADVTQDLAAQVFEAVELLLQGFEHAAARETDDARIDWLRAALAEPDDHLYQGVLSVVLRLVFLLYAEDQGLLPVDHDFYAKHLSLAGLFDELTDDAGQHPESMHHRFGAYGRLLALFRAVFLGVRHGTMHLPPRHGRLFDPNSYPFLEGGLPGSTSAIVAPDARAEVRPPAVDDGVIHAVLSRLILFEGQRLSYRALDVEQIGSVYESLMGYHVHRTTSPAVRIGKNRVWVEVETLRESTPTDRKKWLKQQCGLTPAQMKKIEDALKGKAAKENEERRAGDEAGDSDPLVEVLSELSPGRKSERRRHRAPVGRLVLQPGEERRRSGSHYTPRSLTERIVRRTLEPILACLGDAPTEEQILSLKICDPAMGSGAFLVEACRHLADQLVAVWTRTDRLAAIAEEHENAHLHARRRVAQRCLYGVDKNPAAVELAKLSLWLITLSPDLPFTFVDHALRHGDALVGLDLKQISAFHWKPEKQLDLFETNLRDALDQAIAHRQDILALAHREHPAEQQEKRRLLDHAEQATAKIRLIADTCIGAFFAESKTKAREEERQRRMTLVEQYLKGDTEAEAELHDLAATMHDQTPPFHWWIEFPEVFYEERPDPLCGGEVNGAAYMEAFVGNPPFSGRNGIIEANSDRYLTWTLDQFRPSHGGSDLSAYFFRRAAALAGQHGTVGLISTNTIAQGDTRDTGLKPLVAAGWSIYEAVVDTSWPGSAAVMVSIVHLVHGSPTESVGRRVLGVLKVETINSRLRAGTERDDALQLASNSPCRFPGSKIYGRGFFLDPDEYTKLVELNRSNSSFLFPVIGGEDVNSAPDQACERYVINFGKLSLDRLGNVPDLLAIVRERVKPERDKAKTSTADGEHRKRYWWQFSQPRPDLYEAIVGSSRCLVTAAVSKHLMMSFQPTNRVFTHQLYVFPLESYTAFAVLQSRVHEPWARLLSSSMKTDLRYAASDCFDTFPFPQPDPRTVIDAVEAAGEALYEARAKFMVETDQGLTKTYNALKDPANEEAEVVRLRELHEAMDRAVLDAYGWGDVEVPPFCPRNEEEKGRLAAFEDEIIDRLYVLNAERAREEERLGLRGKGKKSKASSKSGAKKTQAKTKRTKRDADPEGQGKMFAEGDA